ncbi:hypothetical protein C8R44DRAFT_394705 [Mycena epipterygia]|nr:hypothetical protein C8R44DRAFT_394705 [Mycena epipterygia]
MQRLRVAIFLGVPAVGAGASSLFAPDRPQDLLDICLLICVLPPPGACFLHTPPSLSCVDSCPSILYVSSPFRTPSPEFPFWDNSTSSRSFFSLCFSVYPSRRARFVRLRIVSRTVLPPICTFFFSSFRFLVPTCTVIFFFPFPAVHTPGVPHPPTPPPSPRLWQQLSGRPHQLSTWIRSNSRVDRIDFRVLIRPLYNLCLCLLRPGTYQLQ